MLLCPLWTALEARCDLAPPGNATAPGSRDASLNGAPAPAESDVAGPPAGGPAAREERKPAIETVTVTATRRALDRRALAAAVTRVDASALRVAAPSVIAEALRGQPGAFFQQTTPGQGTPIVRGLKGSQLLHLVDGMRLNNAFFRDAPNQYLALVDPMIVAGVEVLRGASGSLYGSDAMGGVVALQTRMPRPGSGEPAVHGVLHGRYESADHGLLGHARMSSGNDEARLAGSVSWQQRRDRRTGDGETVRPSGFEARAAHLALAIDRADSGAWLFQAQTLEQPATPRVDELVPGFGQSQPSSEQFQFEPNRRDFVHGRYQAESDRPWASRWEINLARQVIVDDRRTQDFGSPLEVHEQNKSTLDGMTAQVRSLLGEGLDGVWGVEVYRDEVRSARQVLDLGTGEMNDVRGRFPDRATQDMTAVYAQLNWTASAALTVEAGLRYSRFATTLPADASAPRAHLTPDDLTGDLRLRWTLRAGLQLLANAGRGVRAPNLFDLGSLGPRPGNRFNVANPSLAPESVWSTDLGLRAWGSSWEAELFVFALDYRDRIGSVPTGEVTDTGRIVVRSENRAQVEIVGLEAGVAWQFSEALRFDATLNLTRGTDRGSDPGQSRETPADRIPPLNGRLGVRWRPATRWTLEAWTLFTARQDRLSPRDVLDPRIDPRGTPGWITANVRLSWTIKAGQSIGLQLSNLFDAAYREHGSGLDAPGRSLGAWFDARF